MSDMLAVRETRVLEREVVPGLVVSVTVAVDGPIVEVMSLGLSKCEGGQTPADWKAAIAAVPVIVREAPGIDVAASLAARYPRHDGERKSAWVARLWHENHHPGGMTQSDLALDLGLSLQSVRLYVSESNRGTK